jgi:hypothetical protein
MVTIWILGQLNQNQPICQTNNISFLFISKLLSLYDPPTQNQNIVKILKFFLKKPHIFSFSFFLLLL